MVSSVLPKKVKDREELFQVCYDVPKLFGQLKTHKDGMPIRPVVAYYSSPNFKLSKYLSKMVLILFQLSTSFCRPQFR